MTTKASDENRAIARNVLNVFGGKPKVNAYRDDNGNFIVDILKVINRPYEGVASYSTIGLSDYFDTVMADGTPLGVEIVGVCDVADDQFANILSSCALSFKKSEYSLAPGEICPNVIDMYYPDSNMKHILFVSSFLWEDLQTLEFPTKTVAWLLAIPISENEYRYAQEKGSDALEQLLEDEQIDIFDLDRDSVL